MFILSQDGFWNTFGDYLITATNPYYFTSADNSIYQYINRNEKDIVDNIPSYFLYVQLKRRGKKIIILSYPMEFNYETTHIFQEIKEYLINLCRRYISNEMKNFFLPSCCFDSVLYIYIYK